MEGGWRLCQFGSTMEAGQAVPHRLGPQSFGERERTGVWQIVIERDGMARCVKGQVREENESRPGGGQGEGEPTQGGRGGRGG
jgi:hypothetical protein